MSSDSDGGRDIIYLRTEGVSGNGVPQRLRHLNSPETRALPTDISSQHVDDGPPTSINRNRVSLLGGAFATLKQEKRYRGAQVGAKTIEIDDLVVCEAFGDDGIKVKKQGVVRYIAQHIYVDARSSVKCHIHWVCDNAAAGGGPNEIILKHGTCQEVDVRLVDKIGPVSVGQTCDTGQFVKHVYQSSFSVWRDLKRLDKHGRPACDACLWRVKPIPIEFHKGDCVLIDERAVTAVSRAKLGVRPMTSADPTVWRVALVLDVLQGRCRVQLFERPPQRAREARLITASERRVILTTHELEIDVLDILDRAFVTKDFASTSELTPGRAFFCDQRIDHTGALVGLSRPLAGCQQCTASAREKEALYQEFRHSTRLPAIDYYSGGGGGIQGGADCFDHRYAVEKDVNCCHTLRQNFPNMTVICQSVGAASQHAHLARGRRIRYPGQLGAEPSLPKTGSMSLALAGPPCQGHTGANHQNKLLDPRNDEVFTAIDEIERLRPDIFILENVPGMKMEKDEINVEDTRNYTLAAVRRLRRIGYQCRVTVLDARSFGSPQNRKRLFIVCARQGVPLPTNPEPTHANPELTVNSFAIDGSARLFYVGPKGTQGSAPYPAVTVRDALSDMPAFDYELGQMGLGMRFAADGQSGDRVGFRQLVAYARPAANDYQHRLRGGNGAVFDHYTPTRSARVLRIIAAASVMVGEKSGTDVQGKDRRINPDRGATTLLTDSGPGGMYTGAIHWDQRRTLTVAERKRLQGVPDSYKLSGSVQEQDRMLGNMINVDMSRALHGHIHREVFFPAWLEMGQPCGDDFFKIWRERYPV